MAEGTMLAVVRTQFEAWHYWPDAPDEQKYLRDSHRHIFHVEVAAVQSHNNRDVEYHDMKRKLDRMLGMRYQRHLYEKSCEMVAQEVAEWGKVHGYEVAYVKIFEDNENGAHLILLP